MATPGQGSERPRVLLVEDDQDIASLVQLHLQDIEADVTHVARGDGSFAPAASACRS